MYYKGAKSAVVVYDITQNESFNGAKIWANELLKKGNKNCVIVMVGNKFDLVNQRKVNLNEVKEFIEENNFLHIETSAKSSHNVKQLFIMIAKKLIERNSLFQEEKNNIKLENENNKKKIQSGCC